MADTRLQELEKTNRNPSQETEYQNLKKSQPTVSAPQIPDFNAFFSQAADKRAQFNAGQAAQQNDVLARYRQTIAGQETQQALADRIGKELNLPALQTAANNVNTSIANMPYTQRQATRGFDVNNNQLERLTNQKISELAPVATSANNAANLAQQNLSTRMGYAMADQQKQLAPYQLESSMMSERLAREASGFNTDMTNELNGLIQKMNAGIQLSQFEQTRADQLAQHEQSYELQKQQLDMQQSAAKHNFVSLGGKLYDTVTGQWITPPGTGTGTTKGAADYLGGGQSTQSATRPPLTSFMSQPNNTGSAQLQVNF